MNAVIHRRISSLGPQKLATGMNRILMGGSGKRPTYPMVSIVNNVMTNRRSFAASTTISQESREKAKSPYELGPHRSDAEDLAAALRIIEVDSDVAICSGGGGVLGHPLEYIQLNKVKNEPSTCNYCSQKFIMKQHH
eukprot:460846_1